MVQIISKTHNDFDPQKRKKFEVKMRLHSGMIEKAIFWFTVNRKKIGYTVGTINVLSGLSLLAMGNTMNGVIQLFVGSVLIFDAWGMQ